MPTKKEKTSKKAIATTSKSRSEFNEIASGYLLDTLVRCRAEWEEIEFRIKHSSRAILYGPPGIGKTRAASLVLGDSNSVVRTMITPETCAAEVRGHWTAGPDGFTWLDGPGIQSWRSGSRLVIDEIDMAGGDTIPFLHALLDDNEVAAISLPTGETLKPKKGFSVVATMNSTLQAIPSALRDRFVVAIEVNNPDPKLLFALPEVLRKAAAVQLYGSKASRFSEQGELRRVRCWIEIARQIREYRFTVPQALRVIGIKDPTRIGKAITALSKT